MLIKVVTAGGNLLLNIGPDANGQWDSIAYNRLKEIGDWMKINGEAIYNTRPSSIPIYNQTYFTAAKDKSAGYILELLKNDGSSFDNGIKLEVQDVYDGKFNHIQLLGTPIKMPIQKYVDTKGTKMLRIVLNNGDAIKSYYC